MMEEECCYHHHHHHIIPPYVNCFIEDSLVRTSSRCSDIISSEEEEFLNDNNGRRWFNSQFVNWSRWKLKRTYSCGEMSDSCSMASSLYQQQQQQDNEEKRKRNFHLLQEEILIEKKKHPNLSSSHPTLFYSTSRTFSCSLANIMFLVLVTVSLASLRGVEGGYSKFSSSRSSGDRPLSVVGAVQPCDNEGEVFPLPVSIGSNPCFTCLCKGGRVECEKQQCPSLQGCFLIVLGQKQGCCEICKTCKVGNTTYPSGTELTENCIKTTCTAGVLTRSQINCYTPCPNPSPPIEGECCPTCPTCNLNGRQYAEGDEAILPEDHCVRCKCHNSGEMKCTKQACPVLACPPSNTYLERGECCPRCNGSRTRFVPKQVCLLGDKAYPNGTTFRLDTCTNCKCEGNTAVCERISCPALDCPIEEQILDGCCAKCNTAISSSSSSSSSTAIAQLGVCIHHDRVYNSGERWDVSNCMSCICDKGKTRCTEQMCRKNIACPWGYKLTYLSGKCCPECVGDDGVCTVFGDPHYRSFDGRVFNFQGACKYVLASDCKGKTFAVRVRNDARESRAFSWTRTVTLKVREGRITLGQKMRIKVNGKRVALPYNHGTLSIYYNPVGGGHEAIVETGVGVKLLWDGDSFVEVSVPHEYRGKVCGLCGNFNGNKTDDFSLRRGGGNSIGGNSVVGDSGVFGASWRVGGKKSCSRLEELKGGNGQITPPSSSEPTCKRNWRARQKAEKMCNALRVEEYDRGVFSKCHKAVAMERFFKSCTFDMCECPVGRKCHCEVFTAYARACQRSGIMLGDWRSATGCSSNYYNNNNRNNSGGNKVGNNNNKKWGRS